jgi:hypothetical protein
MSASTRRRLLRRCRKTLRTTLWNQQTFVSARR